MNETLSNLDRLRELLADRATQGLSAPERYELDELLHAFPNEDDAALDFAATAIDLPFAMTRVDPLPAALRQKLEADAKAWLARRQGMQLAGSAAALPARTRPTVLNWGPWLLAAACLVLAVLAWWPTPVPRLSDDPAALRQALLARPGTTTIPWASDTVTGDVVWNDAEQAGYMRLTGLDVNDPSQIQYQLWIFDSGRAAYSDNTAVDGGVFDVAGSGEVIIPIQAKLEVFEPSLFAITTEPPGGVVKHNPDRDPGRFKIVLTAPVE